MIGVASGSSDATIAEEFFELFKTAWEPVVAGRHYSAIVSTDGQLDGLDADLVVLYGSRELPFDRRASISTTVDSQPGRLDWATLSLPIYGAVARFEQPQRTGELSLGRSAVDYKSTSDDRLVWRIGYDLFQEVRLLLTLGQPGEHALIPTLDLHVDLLRHVLSQSGVAFVEVPPHPHAHPFICCLTHDVDFFGIRRQGLDRTLAGFVVRGSVGSLVDFFRGRRSGSELLRNWTAVLSLPLVYAGVMKDFWQPFEDYAAAEAGRRSTFFLVPVKNRAGVGPRGSVDSARAVPYQASEIRPEAAAAAAAGAELAVHGIDAWRDADAGRRELDEVASIDGRTTAGVRMHWLYFDADSPRQLESAGFSYDSTVGYNEAVGYRAGTSQAYRIPGTADLMELPLTIMDSALFSTDCMDLAPESAATQCHRIVSNAKRFGGTVVVNWHCRSLAPERLWGRFYRDLLNEISAGGDVWFATAGEAVDWFRWRRSIRFRTTSADADTIEVSTPTASERPALLRVYAPGSRRVNVQEYPIDGKAPIAIRLPHSERQHV